MLKLLILFSGVVLVRSSYPNECNIRQNCNQNACENGKCIQCNIGHYGQDCDKNCTRYCKNRKCDRISGNCLDGCSGQRWGDKCHKECNHGCGENGVCNKLTGKCIILACKRGWYGGNCGCNGTCLECVCDKCVDPCDPYSEACVTMCESVCGDCADRFQLCDLQVECLKKPASFASSGNWIAGYIPLYMMCLGLYVLLW